MVYIYTNIIALLQGNASWRSTNWHIQLKYVGVPLKLKVTDFTVHTTYKPFPQRSSLQPCVKVSQQPIKAPVQQLKCSLTSPPWSFNVFKFMLTLQHRDQRITVCQTKMTWRDLHIVWLAMDGWITAWVLMCFQPTYVCFWLGRSASGYFLELLLFSHYIPAV